MHYKRDLEAIKLEFSTVSKLIMSEERPELVRSASGVECIDDMLGKLMQRFVVKSEPVETAESETNTSFEEKENLGLNGIVEEVEEEVEEEEVITPRMMQDITNTVTPAKSVTPKKQVPRPGFIS